VSGDIDELDAVARYAWNLALCCALAPGLHFLEVTLRNHVFEVSRTIVDERGLRFREVACWLDAEPSLLQAKEAAAVEGAKAALRESRRPMTPGRLVSKLPFGFWVSLCKRPYEQSGGPGPALWPALAVRGFPFMTRSRRSRSQVFHSLDRIRLVRNRISHHEPVWDRQVASNHRDILEAISWMNLNLAQVLAKESRLEALAHGGHRPFRVIAERAVILRQGPTAPAQH
jgi:hypothetical protein